MATDKKQEGENQKQGWGRPKYRPFDAVHRPISDIPVNHVPLLYTCIEAKMSSSTLKYNLKFIVLYRMKTRQNASFTAAQEDESISLVYNLTF